MPERQFEKTVSPGPDERQQTEPYQSFRDIQADQLKAKTEAAVAANPSVAIPETQSTSSDVTTQNVSSSAPAKTPRKSKAIPQKTEVTGEEGKEGTEATEGSTGTEGSEGQQSTEAGEEGKDKGSEETTTVLPPVTPDPIIPPGTDISTDQADVVLPDGDNEEKGGKGKKTGSK